MRLVLTAVSPRTHRWANIVLDVDPATKVTEIASALGRFEQGGRPEFEDRMPGPPLFVDGQRLNPASTLAESLIRDGAVVSLGSPAGCLPPLPAGLVAQTRPGVALARSADGVGIDFNRPPRLLPPEQAIRVTLPVPPTPADRRPLPILMVVLPLVMGVAMAFLLHQIYLLAMAGLSPVLLIGSALSERKHGKRSTAARESEYAERKARIRHDVAEALNAERSARREQCPDPNAILLIAVGPRSRLWERRRTDPDYLLLRVGIADLPSAVEMIDPEKDEHRRTIVPLVREVPLTIPLRERTVIGLAGPSDVSRAAGRWLVAQAAALHSPNDLRIYVLTATAGQASWEWVRWLPHCRPGPGGASAQIGNDAESVGARIAELLAIIAQRQEARDRNPRGGKYRAGRADGREAPWYRTEIMVVLDGARKLRSLPGLIQVLQEGPEVGIYAVCLDGDQHLLPAECQAVAVFEPDGLHVHQALAATVAGARPDLVSPGWCNRLARAMAPIRDVSTDEDSDGIPDAAQLLDILGLDVPASDMVQTIAQQWQMTGRSTVVTVGVSYDGPFAIDIKKDGPHGLIAGTTGSGKSELLQTLVAALAVANRPDELTFVLVDYKGGSAFSDCARLPHTVGMVTDLSPHLVERALESLSAELTRREHLLAAAGAKDIEEYQRELDRGARRAGGTLPRLVIVIDEFASLVRDLPDFVAGLVNIAQRGRSLGIHLLLATQRPSGVVSADIRANTNLRIALRMTDTAESSDVIDAPDAANITKATPGRAYVRLGHASLVPFQAGRAGGPYSAGLPHRPNTAVKGVWLAPVTWADLGRPEPLAPANSRRSDDEITELQVLVEHIRLAASALGIPAQPTPWLPPLPGAVYLSDIWPAGTAQLEDNRHAGYGEIDPTGGWRQQSAWDEALVPFGVADFPAGQTQELAGLSLTTFAHLMAAGAPGSGRSQLLRTIGGALALAHSCADVHMYGIDCGNGALLPLTELAHCGAVVSRSETDRAARLLRRLDAELTARQELLAGHGLANITEQRAAAASAGEPYDRPLPHIFLLLDRWEGFTTSLGEADNGALTEVVTRILSEGASVGVHLVMTGDRSLLAGRISSLCEEKLVFKLADKEDYALAGLRSRDMPDDVPAGRAFRADSGIEIQAALLAPDPTGQGQAAALRTIAETCARRNGALPVSLRPFRVDAAPSRITFEQAWALRPTPEEAGISRSSLWGLVGVGGDYLQALGPDLRNGVPAFIVAGPGRSGRSTILVAMARSFLAAGTRVVLVAPRPTPLCSLAEAAGVARLFTGDSLSDEELDACLASLDGPGVVLIDDAELLRDCDASASLRNLLVSPGRGLVLAGDPEAGLCSGFSGWQVDAKRARRGCLTAPSAPSDGELVGIRLTRGQIGQPPRPGRCLLNTGDGNLVAVTVPSFEYLPQVPSQAAAWGESPQTNNARW